MERRPPPHTLQPPASLQHPSYRYPQLPVGCRVFSLSLGYLRPTPLPSLVRGSSRWVSRQYFWVSKNMRKISRAKKLNKTSGPQTDGRTNSVDNLLPPLIPLPLGQAITLPSKGNRYIFLTRRHNARRGWCCSIGKISINFAPVAFMNAKTSHGPECGWLTQCQPWFYYCFLPPYTQSK